MAIFAPEGANPPPRLLLPAAAANPELRNHVVSDSVSAAKLVRQTFSFLTVVLRFAMLLESLREEVLRANQEIARRGLAPHTFGNASGVDRSGAEPLVVIKPSGVDYASLTPADLVVTDLDGKIVQGTLRPSSDLDTHTLLYREFPMIGGIVHTHSEFATSWAQAGRPIPCLGTTHADYFHGPVPVTEPLTAEEVAEAYVRNTGAVIVRRFQREKLDPIAVPGVLVAGHAPFAWGTSPSEAVEHADVLEYIARLAWRSILLGASESGIPAHVSEHHYLRKHGPKATYGQVKGPGSHA
jgi:L-ribulose-5-phosphate 4-epimerase